MFGLGSGYVTYYGDHKQRIVIVLVSVVPLIILLTAQSGLICRCVRLNFSSAVLLRESTQNNFISNRLIKETYHRLDLMKKVTVGVEGTEIKQTLKDLQRN